MTNAEPINRNLFNIYLLFTREPFVRYFTQELEFFSNGNRSLLGLISLDFTDNDYYAAIFSRDDARQYRAVRIEASIETIELARDWINKKMGEDLIISHEDKSKYFDLFSDKVKNKEIHPYYKVLNENLAFKAAKDVIKEISYHYKDIDGNFIQQFQSFNGFDARLWELYLFCMCREEMFSFKRNSYAPDFIIEKFGKEIAIEAVIIARDKNAPIIDSLDKLKTKEEIDKLTANEMPLKYSSSLTSKLKKKYWEKEHVKGKPFLIAIADFHEDMSMTWSFNSIIDYLYGTKYSFYHEDDGALVIEPEKIKDYIKKTGTKIPSGFFNLPDAENVSAVIFSSIATLSKFNRMGKQAGLGSDKSTIVRMGFCYNHDENASKPNTYSYTVTEDSKETWAEGVSIFHNPNAKIPLDKSLFPSVAHHNFEDGMIYSDNPDFLPYNSFCQNIITKE